MPSDKPLPPLTERRTWIGPPPPHIEAAGQGRCWLQENNFRHMGSGPNGKEELAFKIAECKRLGGACAFTPLEPKGLGEQETFIRILEIAPSSGQFHFGGGEPLLFIEVDWFNDNGKAGTPGFRRMIEEFIRGKNYFSESKAYLVLNSVDTFTIGYTEQLSVFAI